MSLDAFRTAVHSACRLSGHAQKDLAREVGVTASVLSTKLHNRGDARLTHPEIKRILTTLVAWGGLTTRAELHHLLGYLALSPGFFSTAEWQTPPLSQLAVGTSPLSAVAPATASPTRTVPPPLRIPAQPTPFIGRDAERAHVGNLIRRDDVRLLTVTGPGGIGKTRLALQVLSEIATDFHDGVYFVPLATLTDPALVMPTIAHSCGLEEKDSRTATDLLRTWLNDRHSLLVLDNFEQVDAAAAEVADLLTTSPFLKILVTSRALLAVYGEHEYAVPPLPVPPAENLSVGIARETTALLLFEQRARAARADFALTAENVAPVAAICARLDGLPLAIELAAARCRYASVETIRIQLVDRLGQLIGGPRNVAPRHQTLRNTFAWSYALLSAPEQALFATCGVFAACGEVAAVIAVAGAPACPGYLEMLAQKSLLQIMEGPDSSSCFRMLELIHAYAREQLAALPAAVVLRDRHTAYYRDLAEALGTALQGPVTAEWLARGEAQLPNFRAVVERALETQDAPLAYRMGVALAQFWILRGYLCEAWVTLGAIRALPQTQDVPATLQVSLLRAQGRIARLQGNLPDARQILEEAQHVCTEDTDSRELHYILNELAITVYLLGEEERAQSLLMQAYTVLKQSGQQQRAAYVLSNIGVMAERGGDYDRAATLFLECLGILRALDDLYGLAAIYGNLGKVCLRQKKLAEARAYYQESLATWDAIGGKEGLILCLEGLGCVAADQSDPAQAARLLGVAARARVDLTMPLAESDTAFYTPYLTRAQSQWSAHAWARAWAQAQTESFTACIATILSDPVPLPEVHVPRPVVSERA